MSSKYNLDSCLAILRESTSYREALESIQQVYPGCTGAALRAAFARGQLASPKEYVGQSQDIPIEWDDNPGPCPDPQPDRYWVDKKLEPKTRIITSTTDIETWVVWSDAHIPFEDKRAFDLTLRVCQTIKPYGTAVIGDFADMLAVSSHAKCPESMRWQLADEVDAVNARLDQIDALECKVRRYHVGNHETRGQRLAMKQAIGLYKTLDPANLYRLRERGWEVYGYQVPATVGKVHLQHDTGYAGKYAAFQNGAAFESSTVQGHTHAATCVYFGNIFGDTHVSATIGWLGSREAADYIAPVKVNRNWQHAFGVIYVEPSGNSHFQLVPIIDYKCVVNGQLFVG